MSVSSPFLKFSVLLVCAAALSACTTIQAPPPAVSAQTAKPAPVKAETATSNSTKLDSAKHMYRAMNDGQFQIPAINLDQLKTEHQRTIVDYKTTEKPGTIIVDQPSRYLYFVLPDGKAVRYAVGVGPVARAFQGGEAVIANKAAWPRWTPTPNMIKRNPQQYGRFKDGVDGGPRNPMGARALYMHKDGIDTYYRVHGTNNPTSIGKGVSAGCIRMLNQDVIDLHSRVKVGAKIVVK